MNPEIKVKWVAALRSGKYKQGKRRLTHAGRYCCLGVLCELAVEEGITVKSNNGYGKTRVVFDLPIEVRNWSGVNRGGELPAKEGDGYEDRSLAGFNDHGMSFEKIATIIEEEL